MVDAVDRPRSGNTLPSADQVADYLKQHPEFFQARDDLLLTLELTHPASGNAVSLLERQVSILRERNMDMRQRLAGLVENARNNDRLFEQTRQLVLALLETRSLDDIATVFERSLTRDFQVDFASLTFFGTPEHHPEIAARLVPFAEAHQQLNGLLRNNRAVCGTLRDSELAFLFPNHADKVGSAAVVPLIPGPALGILAIGSRDPEHFRSSMGTLFLSYVAEVLNRLLPRHLSQDG